MAMTADDILNEYVECTVCGSDTALLCSPCGDPICSNCACPNGCEAAMAATPWHLGWASAAQPDALRP
jgi:hypothetical protein